jgi:hypothetical protein
MSSNCCACGKSNGFTDGGWININPTTILQFVNEDADEIIIEKQDWFICQTCATYATAAWARECRRKDQIKNPPPTPTNSPAGAGSGTVDSLEAVA